MEMIRQDILSGILKPGQKLVVAELTKQYHVGASPIREALVQLSWRKYVQFAPQKGCWVSPISVTELDDLYQTNLELSRLLLSQAIQAGNEEWELNIVTAYHRLSRLQPADVATEFTLWEKYHRDFHLALLMGCQSTVMLSLYHQVYEQIGRYRHIWLSHHRSNDERYHDHGEHEAIMKAVLQRDSELALALLGRHSQRALDHIKRYL
ncbi:FCD domain-containing protein [Photobacterium japonica]